MRRRANSGILFVNLLGGFRVAGPTATDVLHFERKKTRALLSMLALDPGQVLPRGKIAALLWPDHDDEAARHALRQCLLDLRHVLATVSQDALRVEGDLIYLEPSTVVVDVARFERHVAQGTAEALQEAVALYRGDLLEGFSIPEESFEDWLRAERERLRTLAVGAMKRLLGCHERENAPDAAVAVAVRLLALEPFDEAVHRALMRLYAASGRRSAALRQYEECVDLLGRELGAEPEAATRELYRRLLSERSTPAGASSTNGTHRRRQIRRAPKARPTFLSIPSIPLIGREPDLEWLDTFSKRLGQKQPQLVLLVGEAGIGKSRLGAEFAVRARQHRAEVLWGRGREGESILPFAPWIEALRSALGARCVKHLPPVIRHDLARLFPEIEDTPGPVPGGLEDGPRIFEAVAYLLRELAAQRRVVVVIEDLHWCDDMTVHLLRFLPRRLEGRPVLLLGTARPEDMPNVGRGVALDTLTRDPACAWRALQPLSREGTTQLFRVLLSSRDETLPLGLIERAWKLSEGNPFVVVECARAVRDRSAVGPDESLGIPDQVRALSARGLAHLSDGAARIADVAAVIGRDFDAAVIGHAARLAESDMADAIEELVRRGFFREIDGHFDFRHDRVREVVYGRLLGPRRTLLHRQVAQALEAVYQPDLGPHCAAIGGHYREAGIGDAAGTYLARAGFQAWERGAGREALECFEDALQTIARLPDSGAQSELHVHLGLAANGAHVATGSYERGRRHLHAIEPLAATLPDPRWRGLVATALSNSYRAAGALDDARRFGKQALEVGVQIGDRGLESVAKYVLGQAENNAGNFRRSLEHLTALLGDEAQVPNLPGPLVSQVDRLQGLRVAVRYSILLNYVQIGEFEAGMRLLGQWTRDIDGMSDPLGTARLTAHIQTGRLCNGFGDFEAAVHAYEAARAIYREDCQRQYNRPLTWGLGVAYALAGRVEEGLDLFARSEAYERQIGSTSHNQMRLLHHSLALLVGGRTDDAERYAGEALREASAQGSRPEEAGAHRILGEVASLREPVDEDAMERHLLAALALAEALEMRPLAARCHLRLAWLYERAGRPEQQRHGAAAVPLLAMMGNPRSLDAAGVH